MNGGLMSCATLVARGNAFLAGDENAIKDIDNNLCFRYSKTIEFTSGRNWDARVASNCREWFDMLNNSGAKPLSLAFQRYLGDTRTYMMLGFANSGTWAIRSEISGTVVFWHNNDEVQNQKDPDQKIWRTGFAGFAPPPEKFEETFQPSVSVQKAREGIAKALTKLNSFVEQQNIDNWGRHFSAGLVSLASETPLRINLGELNGQPLTVDYASVFPEWGYALESLQLFGACGAGFVFGGMGWWNDQSFQDQAVNAEYEALTKELYVSLIEGIGAAVNSFDSSRTPLG